MGGRLRACLLGDNHVVNCLEQHPTLPLTLATSGAPCHPATQCSQPRTPACTGWPLLCVVQPLRVRVRRQWHLDTLPLQCGHLPASISGSFSSHASHCMCGCHCRHRQRCQDLGAHSRQDAGARRLARRPAAAAGQQHRAWALPSHAAGERPGAALDSNACHHIIDPECMSSQHCIVESVALQWTVCNIRSTAALRVSANRGMSATPVIFVRDVLLCILPTVQHAVRS